MSNEELHPCWHEKVKHLPLQKPLIVQDTDTIEASIRLMQDRNRSCLLVLNQDSFWVGIVTERDFMRLYIGTDLPSSNTISDVMTQNVFTVDPELDVTEAMNLFGSKPFRHLPVCDKGEILGLLSVRVLIDFIAEHVPEETLNLPPLLGDVPKEPFGA